MSDSAKKPNFHGSWPIPKRWDLPGLRVLQTKLTESATHDGAWLYNLTLDKALMTIDRRLPVEVQRYTYLHELLHCVNDLVDIMLERFPDEVMTKSMYQRAHPEWTEPGSEAPSEEDA